MTEITNRQAKAIYPLLLATRRAGAGGLTMSDASHALRSGGRTLAVAFDVLLEHGFVHRRFDGGKTRWFAGPPVADERELLWGLTRRKADHDV